MLGNVDSTLQKVFADACFREGSEDEIREDFAAYLDAQGVTGEARAEMLAAPQRLTIYRRLVRNSLEGVTYKLLSRTRARMQVVFDTSFDEFLEKASPRTHFLKDVPSEFLAWVEPRWRARADVPDYLLDLAHYELLHFAISSMPHVNEPTDLADVALDRPLAFSSVARLLRVQTAVHLLPFDDLDDRTVPETIDRSLLFYRDEGHVVRVLEVGPLAFEALALMFEGSPLGEAVRSASEKTAIALNDELLAQFAVLLADLGERGVLLGARAD
jgi:uncharacterized protein